MTTNKSHRTFTNTLALLILGGSLLWSGKATAQLLRNDTVKIKAITHNIKIETKDTTYHVATIVKGYAVYSVRYDPYDIDPGFDGRSERRRLYTLIKLLAPNKQDTLKNVYDFKESGW